MHIKVDQSGKAKMDKHGYTVIAFSDHQKKAAILIPSNVKEACRQYLQDQGGILKGTLRPDEYKTATTKELLDLLK